MLSPTWTRPIQRSSKLLRNGIRVVGGSGWDSTSTQAAVRREYATEDVQSHVKLSRFNLGLTWADGKRVIEYPASSRLFVWESRRLLSVEVGWEVFASHFLSR